MQHIDQRFIGSDENTKSLHAARRRPPFELNGQIVALPGCSGSKEFKLNHYPTPSKTEFHRCRRDGFLSWPAYVRFIWRLSISNSSTRLSISHRFNSAAINCPKVQLAVASFPLYSDDR